MAMQRGSFPDSQLATMLPALNAITFTAHKTFPEQYSKFFNVKNSERAIEQFSGMSGFGLAPVVPEGGRITYDSMVQGFDKTFTHVDYGLGYRFTHQLKRDDKFNIVANMAKELARSMRITVEVEAASDYNNAFSSSFLGPDGKALCATDHPRIKAGGSQANRPATDVDLSIPALEAAMTAYWGWTDDAGKLWMVEPDRVIVAPAGQFTAAEILAGTMKSGTSDNTVNAFRHLDLTSNLTRYECYPYLTDPDAWFLVARPESIPLILFWRERFYTMSDYDFDSRGMKTGGWQAFSHGWPDWPGIYGSQGG